MERTERTRVWGTGGSDRCQQECRRGKSCSVCQGWTRCANGAYSRDQKGISTVAYHIDAFTGKSLQSANDGSDALSLKTIADGLATRAFPIPVDHCKTHIQAIAVVAQDSQVGSVCVRAVPHVSY